jgi:signal transduction histidine kinase
MLPERQRENLRKVRESADDLLDLVNGILDLSKVEAGKVEIKPARFEVSRLIASCCATLSQQVRPGVSLVQEVADEVGEVFTDEGKVRQIVTNLLSNGIKFTEQGEVRVAVKRPPTGDRRPMTTDGRDTAGSFPRSSVVGRPSGFPPSGDLLEIAVMDTGVGIPAEALGYIFEEFHQVEGTSQKEKGTGLGLAITKRFVELLGGTIGVESEVGKGSTFTVRIPLAYREQQNATISEMNRGPAC